MKKLLTIGISCLAILSLGTYVFADSNSPKTSKDATQKNYEVPFEDEVLIDSKIDEKTGVKVDVYTMENWSD
nr:hypothetical protein [Priestia megaterium]